MLNREDIRNIVIKINDEDIKKKLKNLETQLTNAKKQKELLEKKVNSGKNLSVKESRDLAAYAKIIESTEKKLKALRGTSEMVEKTLTNLSKSGVTELKKTLATLQRQINSGQIERGSKEWKRLQEAIRNTKDELQKVSNEQKVAEKGFVELGKKYVGITTTIRNVIDAISGIRQAVTESINAYAEMAEHEANVRKYTGMTTEEVHELNEEFKNMDTRTSREQLNDLAGDAGRLGIQGKKDVLDFVQAADQLNVALGEDLGADGVKNIGKLAQLFGDSDRMGLKQAMLSTGSVINELAQSSSASEGYLMEFTSRLAGVGKQANMTQAQVMSFGSILDQSMVGVERGATAMQNVLTALYQKPQQMAKVAGIDVQHFTELLKTDGNEALLLFIESLNKAGKIDVLAPMLKEMKLSGSGVTQTILALANNIDTLRATQEQATKAFSDGTSVTNEFNVQNNTVKAQLEKTRKRMAEVRLELGEQLIPTLTFFTNGVRVTTQVLTTFIKFVGNNIGTIGKLSLAVAILTAQWNIATIKTKLATAAQLVNTAVTKGLTMAHAALNAVIKANPWGLLLSALIVVGTTIWALVGKTNKLTEANKRAAQSAKDMADIEKAAADNVASEMLKIRSLTAVIKDNNLNLDTRRKALAELQKIVPDYHGSLTQEGKLINNNTDAIKQHIEALRKEAMAEAAKDKLVVLEKARLNAEESRQRRQNAVRKKQARADAYYNENKELIDVPYDKFKSGKEMTTYARYRNLTNKVRDAEELVSEQDENIKRIDARINNLLSFAGKENVVNTIISTGGSGDITDYDNNTSDNTTNTAEQKRRKKAKAADEKIELESKQRLEQMDKDFVVQGRTDYEDYMKERNKVETEYLLQRQSLWKNSDSEWLSLQNNITDASKNLQQKQNEWSLQDIDRQYKEELDAKKMEHLLSTKDEEEKQQELDAIELRHLTKRAEYLRKYSSNPKEVIDAEKLIDDKKRELSIKREEDRQRQIAKLKQDYLKKSAQEQYDYELKMLDSLFSEELRNTETYLRLRKQIELKYKGINGKGGVIGDERKSKAQEALDSAGYKSNSSNITPSGIGGDIVGMADSIKKIQDAEQAYKKLDELRQQDLISEQAYTDAKNEIDNQSFNRFVEVAQAAYSLVGDMMSSYSNLLSAQRDAEVAKVERSYDRQIQAAGKNTKQAKILEEKKQKETAKIKNKYNKKMMAMEIAQALAQTAMNALITYGALAKFGPVVAAAGAALATAAGMIQVAAIKKQHEAQEDGYYSGGFTGGRDYKKQAGVVHEGEFVANHQAVNNPNVAPLLRLIDQAQRNNTIGSLTAEDVSRALPVSVATTAGNITASQPIIVNETERTSEALERLNENIELGISATVVLDGPNGFDRQYRRYQSLIARGQGKRIKQ